MNLDRFCRDFGDCFWLCPLHKYGLHIEKIVFCVWYKGRKWVGLNSKQWMVGGESNQPVEPNWAQRALKKATARISFMIPQPLSFEPWQPPLTRAFLFRLYGLVALAEIQNVWQPAGSTCGGVAGSGIPSQDHGTQMSYETQGTCWEREKGGRASGRGFSMVWQ